MRGRKKRTSSKNKMERRGRHKSITRKRGSKRMNSSNKRIMRKKRNNRTRKRKRASFSGGWPWSRRAQAQHKQEPYEDEDGLLTPAGFMKLSAAKQSSMNKERVTRDHDDKGNMVPAAKTKLIWDELLPWERSKLKLLGWRDLTWNENIMKGERRRLFDEEWQDGEGKYRVWPYGKDELGNIYGDQSLEEAAKSLGYDPEYAQKVALAISRGFNNVQDYEEHYGKIE